MEEKRKLVIKLHNKAQEMRALYRSVFGKTITPTPLEDVYVLDEDIINSMILAKTNLITHYRVMINKLDINKVPGPYKKGVQAYHDEKLIKLLNKHIRQAHYLENKVRTLQMKLEVENNKKELPKVIEGMGNEFIKNRINRLIALEKQLKMELEHMEG